MFLNAATIGLVMSLAKPHKGKSKVTSRKGTRKFLGTTVGLADGVADMMEWAADAK